MKRNPAEAAAERWRLAAVFCCLMGAVTLATPVEAAGLYPWHSAVAAHDGGVIRVDACRGRDCAPPPSPPCRQRLPYTRPRSNIGMREMWELITHGAPMPGTDYYYYRMYEYRKGRLHTPRRRCGR